MILGNQGGFVLYDQNIFFCLTMNYTNLLDLFRNSHWSVRKAVLKKRLQHWCFIVKFAKFLRTSILKNICETLLLFLPPQNTIANSSGEFRLDETLTECKVSIFFLNLTILFDQIRPYHLYINEKYFFDISMNIPIKFLRFSFILLYTW